MDYYTGKYDGSFFDFIEVNRYSKVASLDNGAGGEPVTRRYIDDRSVQDRDRVGSTQVRSCFPNARTAPQSISFT